MPLKLNTQHPETDHRKAVLSLRWIVIILASYLTLFSYLGTESFAVIFIVTIAFSASNVGLMLVPSSKFSDASIQRVVGWMDVFFVTTTLYLLRVAETYLYVAFVAVFLLAVVWRDLRLVLFSVFAVSVLFGVFN